MTECIALFDRFHADLEGALAQVPIHESLEAARQRDQAGFARCTTVPDAARVCLLGSKLGSAAWATCGVDPPFTLFDATAAHDALLGAALEPADAAAKVASLAGTWHQPPAQRLDDAVTWTITASGSLAVRRANKSAKKPVDEPIKQLTMERERLLGIKLGTSTQFVPFFHTGDVLYLSWTSGAIAVPVADTSKLVLDLADGGRWLVWNAPRCSVLDPRRGVSDATCAWEERDGVKTFVVTVDTVAQRWTLRDGALVHPRMESFKKRPQGK